MKDLDLSELARLRQTFDACDRDGDGWITAEEFATLLQSLDHDLSADECQLTFEATDDDGDGLISFEEFMGWWSDE